MKAAHYSLAAWKAWGDDGGSIGEFQQEGTKLSPYSPTFSAGDLEETD